MESLKALIVEDAPLYLAVGGLAIGFVFGYIIYRTNFCTMGSISDIMNLGDSNRFRAWLLAAITAMIGVQLLQYFGIIDISNSIYLSSNFNWLGNVLGGLMFGFGMVYAGGCVSKNLARAGGGDLRSGLVLIVMGFFSYMTIGGIFAPARNWLAQTTSINLGDRLNVSTQSLGDILASQAPQFAGNGNLTVMAGFAVVGLIFIFASKNYRAHPVHIVSGIGIGLCVVAGWTLTSLAFDEMSDKPTLPASLSYVRPTGDTLEYLQRFTADMIPGFGVAAVFGALLGAFAAALVLGRFKIVAFAGTGDTKRNVLGAILMGVGGIIALGCTVGQAVTGVSTLAIGSFLTFFAIVIGGVIGMKSFERAIMAEA